MESEPPMDGGGGTTLEEFRASVAMPLREFPEELPPETDGGGGTILLASVVEPEEGFRPDADEFPDATLGGGGTTSCVPKSLPMMLLTIEVLPVGAGGGGITVREGSFVPLSSRRKSRVESAEGGGAMMEGAGRVSFALRELSRAGAETGGGTTATLFICTREGVTSRLQSRCC
jgi:hypothetical protein